MLEKLVDKFGSIYQEGTVVFREGDGGDEMYIIHEGEVKISLKAKNAEQVLAILKPGDFFGEMAVFTDKSRSATAVVVEKALLLKIKRSSMEYIIQNNPTFANSLIKKLCDRLYTTNAQIEELLVLSKETRVLKAVVSFWKEHGSKDATGNQLIIKLDPFLKTLHSTYGIDMNEAKKILNQLQEQNTVKMRRDKNDSIFVTFSSKIFHYFDVI